jgi:calcineurin-like phosphoesterase family protein
MSNTFLISDTHFGYANILTFKDAEGNLLRPFSSVEEMDETMVHNWNKVVTPSDKVYHLGDVAMHKKYLPILARLNGTKVLIKGNHDQDKASVYLQYFKDIRASHQLDKYILTHIPIHPNSLSRWKANIHGHLHSNVVTLPESSRCAGVFADPRYYCVSVERIGYTPIAFEDLKVLIKG